METQLGVADFVVIVISLVISAAIGVYFRFTGNKQQTTEEFLIASKKMGILPVAFSLMATYLSAISLLGLPAEVYKHGTQYFVKIFGLIIGVFFTCYGILPVFYDTKSATAYEYLVKRFGKVTQSMASFLFAVQMLFYVAIVLYAPSLALSAVAGISTWTSIISLAVVCTFYSTLGGFKAVLWTDVFQAILMFVTVIAISIKGSIDVGGIRKVFDINNDGGRLILFNFSLNYTERYTFWNSLLGGLMFTLQTLGTNQAQVQRMLSVGSKRKAQKALFACLPLIIVFNVFCIMTGIVIYANYYDCDPLQSSVIKKADQLVPLSILKLFSHVPGLSGLCIAGVFSASLSSVSSALNSLTMVTLQDFIKPHCQCKRLTDSWEAFLAKIIALCYSGACLLIVFIIARFSGVLEAGVTMFSMIGGPMTGLYILGMFTKRANELGTNTGLIFGVVFSAWMGFGRQAAQEKVAMLPLTTLGCPAVLNGTTRYSVFANASTSVTSVGEKARYIFPLYRVSYIWNPVIGTVMVIVVGYMASVFLSICRDDPVYEPELFSPFVRKWFFKAKKVEETTQNGTQLQIYSTSISNESTKL